MYTYTYIQAYMFHLTAIISILKSIFISIFISYQSFYYRNFNILISFYIYILHSLNLCYIFYLSYLYKIQIPLYLIYLSTICLISISLLDSIYIYVTYYFSFYNSYIT